MTRVPKRKASCVLWVTKRMVAPVSFQSCADEPLHVSRVPGSSALKASSISRMRGFRHQRLSDGDALLHAAGKLVGILVRVAIRAGRCGRR